MSKVVYERVMPDQHGSKEAAVTSSAYQASIETTSSASTKKFQDLTYAHRSRQTHNYRPASLRPLSLAAILVLTLTLIGILEWAIIRFPHRSVLDEARHAANNLTGDLSKRSPYAVDGAPLAEAEFLFQRAAAASASEAPTTSNPPTTSTPPPPPPTSTPVVSSTSASINTASTPGAESGNAFVRSKSVKPPKPTETVTQQNIIGVIVHSTASSAERQQASPTGSSDGEGDGNGNGTGDDNGNGNGNNSDDDNGNSNENGDGNDKSSNTSNGSRNGNGQSQTTGETGGGQEGTGTQSATGTAVKTGSPTSAAEDTNAPHSLHTSLPTAMKDNGGLAGSGAHPSRSALASASRQAVSASASANAFAKGGSSNTGKPDITDDTRTPLGGAGTFASSYLPTISAVLYRMMWNIIWNSFTLVEPFRVLARSEGASAATAFFSGYQRNPTPLECMTGQKWALGTVTFASSLADLLPALASQMIYVDTDWAGCPNYNPQTPQNPCPRRVEVLVAVIRTMQALLAVACAILLWILAFFYYHNTGLIGDPRSMAAVASLMGDKDLLHDLNQISISSTADSEEMQRQLSHTRYRLSHFVTDSGNVRYGIMHSTYRDEDDIVAIAHSNSYDPISERSDSSPTKRRWHKSDWLLDSILIVVLIGTFAVVLAYHLDHQYNDGFNTFFNSGAFGPSFILTLAATVIATLWKRAEIAMMICASFQRLAHSPAEVESTVYFKPTTTPFASTVRAVQHGYWVVAAVTAVALLSDLVLNVMIGGVAYQHGQSLRQSLASRWLSMVILLIMIVAAVALLISRLRKSIIPRQPDTLAVMMAYLAGGSLPHDFGGMESSERLSGMQKKYQLSKIETAKGVSSWTVDGVDNRYDGTWRLSIDDRES